MGRYMLKFTDPGLKLREIEVADTRQPAALEDARRAGYTRATYFFVTSKGNRRTIRHYVRPLGGVWESERAFHRTDIGPVVGTTVTRQGGSYVVRRLTGRDVESGSYIVVTEDGGKRFVGEGSTGWEDQGVFQRAA